MRWYIILGTIIVILSSIILYIIFKRKKYTRERYAFFATGLIFTYTITVLTHLIFDISLFQILLMLYNQLPFENITIPTTSWSDKVWSVFLLIILCVFILSIFYTWGDKGNVSKLDRSMKDVREDLSFLRAALIGMNPARIDIADKDISKTDIDKKNFELNYLDLDRDWPSETKELLNMYSNQYKINNSEWNKEENSFYSNYMGNPLLVICELEPPSEATIESRITEFKKTIKTEDIKVIIAVKNVENNKENNLQRKDRIYFTKNTLLNSLIDFSDYNDCLRRQFELDEISEGDNVTLKDIYVESEGSLTDLTSKENETIHSVEKHLINWASKNNNEEQIVLLGDYGQGKSVLSLRFANELVKSEIDRQPIIIELRGKSPRNMPMTEMIAAWAYRFNYNVKAILKLLQEGKLVVILEGFDELDMVGDQLRRLEHFKKLWDFARYKKSKIIITGRPNLFLNNEEARNFLQLNNGERSTFSVKAIKLEPFDREKIKLALRNTPENISKSILEHYDSTKSGVGFSDLISRPSTLFQTSIIWESLDKTKLNSSKIINSFIEHAYKRQAQKLLSISGTDLEAPVLTVQERAYFMQGIAVGMVKKGGYSNQISGRELEEIVFPLFTNIPNFCSRDHHSNTSNLHERLREDAFESVFNDVRTAGILVRDLTSINSFKFAHKSFLESLFANFIKMKVNPNNDEDKIIGNTIEKALSVTDIYSLKFSDEVIGHVTENIVNQGQKFDDNEAKSLMNALSKKAKIIDTIFFRKTFLTTKFTAILLIITFTLVIFTVYLKLTKPSYSHINLISEIIFILLPTFTIYLFGRNMFLKSTERIKAAIEIWCRACEVQNYNVDNERVLSKNFIECCRYHNKSINKFKSWLSTFPFTKEIVLKNTNDGPPNISR
ncbi:NACHT domain-containing protein [Shewanella putrefaciens]